MTQAPAPRIYLGWSATEIAADQALVASIHALGQADGLLNPALDPIFARPRLKAAPRRSVVRPAPGRRDLSGSHTT